MNKSSFSTLNRWLGKRSKADKALPNGGLSKSGAGSELSISSTNINEVSQLEYNRITPLPVATSNAPFEQTFRITVLLPKDQLYVARLGARVPLRKLLELVCDNKLLDAAKYEFRNPVDPSQVYSCDLTIGAVGLSEVRLCHKSESYDAYGTADDVLKLQRASAMRDSRSSSEFSGRVAKHNTKAASPYSSTNSLNSMDSSGLNYTRAPPSLTAKMAAAGKVQAPARKKRAAPRPPSQIVIPERSALVTENGTTEHLEQTIASLKAEPLSSKDLSVSTPNLATPTLLSSDINGNDCTSVSQGQTALTPDGQLNGYGPETVLYAQVEKKNSRNRYGGSAQNLCASEQHEVKGSQYPEPSPRKRIVHMKKKAAPAPPPRGSLCAVEDSISILSTQSTPNTPLTLEPAPEERIPPSLTAAASEEPPKPLEREATSKSQTFPNSATPQPDASPEPPVLTAAPVAALAPLASSAPLAPLTPLAPLAPSGDGDSPKVTPKPVPRLTTTTLLNASDTDAQLKASGADTNGESARSPPLPSGPNVSKVLLNRTPTPEPRSLSCEPPDVDGGGGGYSSQMTALTPPHVEDDNVSKQADSGIGEPVPSPLPDSLPSDSSALELKSNFESSSDDDDMIKVYNFKLGKTVVKPLNDDHKTVEELSATVEEAGETTTPLTLTQTSAETVTSWNFSIPISPPPNFADAALVSDDLEAEKMSDTPITPKITERPLLNFEALARDGPETLRRPTEETVPNERPEKAEEPRRGREKREASPPEGAEQPSDLVMTPSSHHDVVDELSVIINEKGLDTLIRRPEGHAHIEAAKPNTLPNFSIATLAEQATKPLEVLDHKEGEDEKLYRKRGSLTGGNGLVKPRKSISRSDSFHSTASASETAELGAARSSSQLSLTKLERRRSSSELSIAESPSLQSLEIIKSIILNSRQSSPANNSDDEKPTPKTALHQQRPTGGGGGGGGGGGAEEVKVASVEWRPKSPEPPAESLEEEGPEARTAKEPPPKLYRYTGPPNINFSTWNERPKAQVSIKNEGDYIFGGKSAENAPTATTAPTVPAAPAASSKTIPSESRELRAPEVAPKPSTMSRLGIPEREFRVPITVRPLKDITVESRLELRQQQHQPPQQHPPQTAAQVPQANGPSRPTIESVLRPQSQTIVNIATLPRTPVGRRFSTPAQNGGAAALLRSTSVTKQELSTAKPSAPFGQNTLRKTGLKEKILAREEQEKQEAVIGPKATMAAAHIHPKPNGYLNGGLDMSGPDHNSIPNSSNKALHCAKLHLKLQRPVSLFAPASTARAPTQSTRTAPIVGRGVSSPPSPPPPPPQLTPSMLVVNFKPAVAVRGPTVASASAATSAPTSAHVDSRDQLMAAIRNFKRNELRRA